MVNENVPLMSENAPTAPPYADPPSYDSATGSESTVLVFLRLAISLTRF